MASQPKASLASSEVSLTPDLHCPRVCTLLFSTLCCHILFLHEFLCTACPRSHVCLSVLVVIALMCLALSCPGDAGAVSDACFSECLFASPAVSCVPYIGKTQSMRRSSYKVKRLSVTRDLLRFIRLYKIRTFA